MGHYYFATCMTPNGKAVIAYAPYSTCWLNNGMLVRYVDEKGVLQLATIVIYDSLDTTGNRAENCFAAARKMNGCDAYRIISILNESSVEWPEDEDDTQGE